MSASPQDMVSYKKEQACNDDLHNMVTIVKHQFGMTVQEAMDWIGEYHRALELAFMEQYRQVPRWGGPVDREVAQYIDGLGRWLRANEEWNFESQRYFGASGEKVRKSHWVDFLPKARTDSGHVDES